ncbi:N-acetylmuramoyl-L-alanine amidase [Pedobacter frigidisoli]|uniref:N-acetylmuramoyl-L-alanine amidase n=1 Tax=Pedobacter frigidisoli TaxID=2530455 RepID=UPI0029313BCC|nr:N-acetylmuramoyl-L-alanine amidase [Pedobacter frigidisoli]
MALIYLLKVSVCMALFFGLYWFFLARLTFFQFNRFYLLALVAMSFAIPSISIEHVREVDIAAQLKDSPIAYSTEASLEKDSEVFKDGNMSYSWREIFEYCYFGIVAVLILRLFFNVVRIKLQLRRYGVIRMNRIVEVMPHSPLKNCSFFNLIIIDASMSDRDKQLVIQHERVHVSQQHVVDKVLANLVAAVLWLNPIVYLWRNAVDHNHEFLADEETASTADKKTYATLLLQLAMPSVDIFAKHFSKLPLKNRIMMLYKEPNTGMQKLVYLAILPVLLICSVAFINKREIVVQKTAQAKAVHTDVALKPDMYAGNYLNNEIQVNQNARSAFNEVDEMTLVLDAGHGGKDDSSIATKGQKEKDLNLRAVKILEEEAVRRGIKVRLTRSADEYVSLRDRLPVQMATAFISIHHNANSHAGASPFGGIEVIVSKQNPNIRLIEELAGGILNAFKKSKGIEINNTLKEANLLLLRESKVPAVLIELGNIADEKSFGFINDEKNIRKISNLILDGFVQFSKRGC